MMKKTFIVGLCICIFAVSPISAAAVSFLVIEAGQPEGNAAKQYASAWENGLLETFFESGHIVSNAPLLRLAEKPTHNFPDEAELDFRLAQEGGMDYFIVTIVEHPGFNVSLRLFSTKSRLLIEEYTYTGKTPNTMKKEYEHIKTAVRVMTAYLR
ncbi:MAG: hypothetical protein FWD36_10050 [Treponema sp.]|nr:hypothetical protein [Treponema sp.]